MRYLVSGYYGEGNAGDEAILAGIIQEVARRDAGAEFVVLSFDPADTERRHGGGRVPLKVIPTSIRSPHSLRATMKRCDLLISGGGSFLHEADFALHGRSFLFRAGKLRPIPYFLSIVMLARSVGLPVMWYAQGLGPLHTRTAKRAVAVAASASQMVTWRDYDSAAVAYEVGVRAPAQTIVPDPVYALTPARAEDAAQVLRQAGLVPERRYLAVCPRPWLGHIGYLENLGAAVEGVATAEDLNVVLVPFHEGQDPAVCETVAARPALAGRALSLQAVSSPAVLAAVLGAAELVVAMRLHSGILSATAGAPAVVVDYDPKTRAFAAQTGQLEWCVSVEELETGAGAAALGGAIRATLAATGARRAALARAVAPLRAEAGRTAQLAVQLAAGGSIYAGRSDV